MAQRCWNSKCWHARARSIPYRILPVEVLNVKVGVKKAIILLLYYTNIKVLKDALAC
jgi:hypothetical protein